MSAADRYGVMGRFADADALVAAARECRRDYRLLEAYAPFPVPGLTAALGRGGDRLWGWTLGGALFGGLSAFAIQYWTAVIDYPLDVGGRPHFSWPAFLPIIILLTLFWAGAGTTLGLLVLNRLPRLHHPLFAAPDFAAASRDGFFLVVRCDGPDFDTDAAGKRLAALGAEAVTEVPP